jgi:hypothetical protein
MRLAQRAALAVLLLWSASAGADDKAPSPTNANHEPIAKRALLTCRYDDFEQALIHLANRMAAGSEPDRERALRMRAAIQAARKHDLADRFQNLVRGLEPADLRDAVRQQKMLADDIKAIRGLLFETRYKVLQEEIQVNRQNVVLADHLIRSLSIVRAYLQEGLLERDEVQHTQAELRMTTRLLADRMLTTARVEAPRNTVVVPRPVKQAAVQVQEAVVPEENVVAKIKAGDLRAARKEQDQVIQKLREARKQLFDFHQVLLQQEGEQVLAALGISPPVRTVKLSANELDQHWATLKSNDYVESTEGIVRMAGAPKQVVPFLGERLKSAGLQEDEKRIIQWIEELDHDQYAVREKAHKALEGCGCAALPLLLNKTLKGRIASLEARRRIERILPKIQIAELRPEQRRVRHALTILEVAGTPDAEQLLEELARGMGGTWLAFEASSTLERIQGTRKK